MTDEALLSAFCRRRVESALGELAGRYEPALLGLARGIIGQLCGAEDAVQEAWLRVIRYGAHFDGKCSVKTWLYRIVINKSLDIRTDSRRLMSRSSVSSYDQSSQTSDIQVQIAHTQDDLLRLQTAIDQLPDSARVVLMLCSHRGVTQEQAAEILGLPLGTLKTRHASAVRQLRMQMGTEPRSHSTNTPQSKGCA